jgi:hypothetical protein
MKNISRVLIFALIVICVIFTFRAIQSTTFSWSSKSQHELRALSEVINIKNAILSFRQENGCNPCPTNNQVYGQMLDPWENSYHIEIAEMNVSNIIVSGVEIKSSVAVWSNGKNRKNEFGKGDDITSWESGL